MYYETKLEQALREHNRRMAVAYYRRTGRFPKKRVENPMMDAERTLHQTISSAVQEFLEYSPIPTDRRVWR